MVSLADRFESLPAGRASKATLSRAMLWLAAGLVLAAFFAIAAARLGNDASPDFRIYHFYNGYAALHDRAAVDIVPAQLQTFFFKGLDVVNFLLVTALNGHPLLLRLVLSIPYLAGGLCVVSLTGSVVEASPLLAMLLGVSAALFGISGAAELPTLATAMSEMTADVPLLIGLAYWFNGERRQANSLRTAVLAGLLGGASVGLKLTVVPVFVGWFAAVAARRLFGVRNAWREALLFGAAGVVMFFAIDLPWLLHNQHLYGNPIMPMMNDIFQSDFVDHGSWADTRFLPRTAKMAVFYPAYWAFFDSHFAIELSMRDPRLLIGWLSALCLLVVFTARLVPRRSGAEFSARERAAFSLALIFLISYALWEAEWSIFRYLAVDEALTGVLLLAALGVCFPALPSRWVLPVFALIALPAAAYTDYPWWSRALAAPKAVDVQLPSLPADSLVIFLDPYAYSYLVPFMPPSVRVVGANNNIIQPGAWGKLQAQAAAAINGQTGPIWGLEWAKGFPGVADSTLRYYHLARDSGRCRTVQSNIEDGAQLQMCPLLRQPG